MADTIVKSFVIDTTESEQNLKELNTQIKATTATINSASQSLSLDTKDSEQNLEGINAQVKELGDEAEGTGGKFKALRSQIRETNVALQKLADEGKTGTKEFQDLSNQLDDLNDAQQRVAFQSAQIEDKLAALPGPIGAIGKSFQSAKNAVDTFGKTLAVSLGIIGLLISAFLAIKESLSRTEEGQAKLNKITEAFEKIMNGLFAVCLLVPLAWRMACQFAVVSPGLWYMIPMI
jgi:DNA repair exonuclease SbcCD ATPase subunit